MVAAWHTAYNLTAATEATRGEVAALSTVLVMVLAGVLVRRDAGGRPAVPAGRR
ncbi:hypothetical protein [Thalassiella azotivora]